MQARLTFLALVAVAVVCYLPVMYGAPIWDDAPFLFENPLFEGDGALYRIWLTTENHDYWPLTYSWFLFFRRAFGADYLPYHLANALLHAANGILIWRILRSLDVRYALVPAVLYLVHPVNVEAVAWMFQAKTLLASAFALGSVLTFLRYEELGRRRDLFLTAGLFGAGMLSKTSVIAFPAVYLLVSAWRNGRPTRRAAAAAIPSGLIGLGLGGVAFWFHRLHYLVGTEVVRDAGVVERMLAAFWALWFYLYKAFLPIHLSFIYPRWEIVTTDPLAWLPAAGAILAVLVLVKTKQSAILYCLAFFALMLLPVLGFVDIPFMQFSLVADHWQYPAIAGPLILAAPVAERLAKRIGKRPAHAALTVAGAGLCVLTAGRAALFVNEISIYRDAVQRAPDNFMVRLNLGKALAAQKDLTGAIEQFVAAGALAPASPDALNNLGSALAESGRPEQAAEQLRKALALDPGHVDANYNLANLMMQISRIEEAATLYEKALERAPDHAEARTNLGVALAQLGRFDQAKEHLSQASRLSPKNTGIRINLARVLANAGDLEAAEAEATRAVEIDPSSTRAWVLLGFLAAKRGKRKEAEQHYLRALQMAPPEMRPQIRAALEQL